MKAIFRILPKATSILCLLNILLLSQSSAFAEVINVKYNITVRGSVRSSVNNLGFDKYNGWVSTTNSGVGFVTGSTGAIPAGVVLTSTKTAVPVTRLANGNKRVNFTVPLSLSMRRTLSEPYFYGPTSIGNAIVDQSFSPTITGTVQVNVVLPIVNYLATPPNTNVLVPLSNVDRRGFGISWINPTDVPGSVYPEFEAVEVTYSKSSAALTACGGVYSGYATVSHKRSLKADSLVNSLVVSGSYTTDIKKIRICLKNRYNVISNGVSLSTIQLGKTSREAIRSIGLAPLGVTTDSLTKHPSGYFYNQSGQNEKWLLRGAYAPEKWSYLLPKGVLNNAVGAGVNLPTDILVSNFNNFTFGTTSYSDAAYVYDHPDLLTSDALMDQSLNQYIQVDSENKLTIPADGNYLLNSLNQGRNEKWIKGEQSGVANSWIIEPSGLLSRCVLGGNPAVYKCTPQVILKTSMYTNPAELAQSYEKRMDDLYRFYQNNGTDNLNIAGKMEKWFRSTVVKDPITGLDMWYYILPNGDVYRWDSGTYAGVGTAADTIVFKTSAPVYTNNLSFLVNLVP
jgi:hypothetical protein